MASIPDILSRDSMKFSISCFDIPDSLLDKSLAKDYFQRFGKLLRVRLRPKQKSCSVEYLDEESAVRALTEGGDYDGSSFRVAWTKEKKKSRKKLQEWPVDSEIQAELEAMRGTFAPSRIFIDTSEPKPKKVTSKKPKTPSRVWKEKTKQPKTTKSDITSMSSEPDNDLLNIIMTSASTSEEKFRVLDARDKLIRSRTVLKNELNIKTVGTCPDMCPEKERIMREVQHQVASYEQLSASKGSMNHSLAVKQYSRSSADQEAPLPHELRPVKVLLLTMGYLLHKIMDLVDTPDVNLAEWYHFLWDRTRGIRKDVTQQELCCVDSVSLVEQCARFHVFCAARLVGEDVSVFDDKINTENLTKCLQTLKYMYHDLRLDGVECPNESEFRGYVILLNLNDGNFLWEVQQLDEKIQRSKEIKFAIDVYSALDKNNYVRFFKLVKSTTHLNACLLLRYFNQVRYRALLTILKSYSPRQPNMQFPINELYRILAFEDIDTTTEFFEYYNLNLNPEKTHVILDRKMFRQPNMPFVQERAKNIVESKRACSVGEVVCGAPIPPADYEKHVPHCSFENGFLKVSELPKDLQNKYQEFLGVASFEQNFDKFDEKYDEKYEEKYEDKPEKQEEKDMEMPVFSFQEKYEENSQPEIDKLDGNFPPKIEENRSSSPLFHNWSKPQKTFSFTSQTIFGTISEPKPLEIEINQIPKPIVTIPSFTFTPPITFTPIVMNPAKLSEPPKILAAPSEPIKKVKTIVKSIENEEKLRLEREMKERTIKKLKEKQELEEKLKRERTLKEQEKRKKELQIKEQLKTDVQFILQSVLNKVEEELVKKRLSEISENIKKRRAVQFFKRWKHITRISRKKRKNFFDNPVWVSSKSAASEAEDLFTPSQNSALRDIKRYKRGTPDNLKIIERKPAETIDIYGLVYRILFEKLCVCDGLLNQNLFWKVCVSFEEDFCLNKVLGECFNWGKTRENVGKKCAINGGSLCFCVKKLVESDYNSLINGLLLIIGDNVQNLRDILHKIKCSLPVVILVRNSTKHLSQNVIIDKLNLNFLLKNNNITSYNIIYYNDNNINTILQSSLQYLAQNVPPKSNLEMDALPIFLRHFIGEEFWFRIYNSSKINKRLEILLQNPQIAIDLHNESLKKCLELIFSDELLHEPHFSSEFKQFVKQQQILLPCSFEHFPDYWNNKNYLNKVKRVVHCLYFPKFETKWPPKDQYELQNTLEQYCSKIFKDPTSIVLKLLSLLLDKIDLTSNFQTQMSEVIFSQVIQLITLEKLSSIQFFDKTHAVYTVAYKNESLKFLREFPWWYSSQIIKNRIKFVEIEEEIQPQTVDIVDESEDELDLDKIYAELEENEEKKKLKQDFKNLTHLLQDLEESMEIQQKIMNKFQEKVTQNFCK